MMMLMLMSGMMVGMWAPERAGASELHILTTEQSVLLEGWVVG